MAGDDWKIVVFGAGNIGRSFIGQLFARGGYEVVFIDIDPVIIDALNEKRSYSVIVKRNNTPDEAISVDGVRAVDGNDRDAVFGEIADASLIATAVGKGALPHVLPILGGAISARLAAGAGGVDIIIAENIRDAAAWYRSEIFPRIPDGVEAETTIGLVETSIGKMVPIMTAEDRETDPLQVFAEEYNTLVVDAKGFRNGTPDVEGLKAVDNIRAYVDRKLFIHNLGHAATAYLGYAANPACIYIFEHMQDTRTSDAVRRCMLESAAALTREYPDDLPLPDLIKHIDDLLNRFGNRELKDTVHRVGRDLTRKLGFDDRLVGAMLLAAKHGLPFESIAAATAAAFAFRAPDESGALYPADDTFYKESMPKGPDWILENTCGLSPVSGSLSAAVDEVRTAMRRLL